MSKLQTSDHRLQAVFLWLLDGRTVRDDELASFLPLLAPDETERHRRFLRAERRRQFLLGRMLLRFAVSALTGIPAISAGTIIRPGFGPQLQLPGGVPSPHFSLSHSREWIACAVSAEHALGLDIEVLDAERDVLALSEASFCADEHACLLKQNGTDRIAAFYRLWTLKEALFKLFSNAGLQSDVPSLIRADGTQLSHGDGWFACTPEHPDLSIAICSAGAAPQVTLMDTTGFQCAVSGLIATRLSKVSSR